MFELLDLWQFAIQKLNSNLITMKEYLMKNWLKSAESPNSNYPFNSRSQRSINLNSSFTNPGPGTYNPPLQDIQKTSKYHVSKQKQPPVQKQFLWMFGSQRESSLNQRDNNILIGPGAYEIKGKQKLLQYSWSRASRFKTTPTSEITNSPGPGDYEYNTKRGSSGAQFVFKSKLKKSLEFPQEKQAKQSPNLERLHDPDIEEQHYQQQQRPSKRSEQKSSVFASKVPRFLTQIGVNKIGPGAYEVLSSSRSRQKSQFPKVVKFKPARAPMFREKVQSQLGPGSYNVNKYTISRDLQFKGYPISRQTRFNFSGKKTKSIPSMPGPGSYMQNKYVYVDPKEWFRQKTSKRLKSFIHESKKAKPKQKGQDSTPRFYNLNSYDIEFRMRKKIEHANKLKLMQISVPGFNSKVPRL